MFASSCQQRQVMVYRLAQDQDGRQYFDDSNSFTLTCFERPDLELLDTLGGFVIPSTVVKKPITEVAENFVERLDIAGFLAGKSPLVALRLTAVKNGSVLGISFSHVVAGVYQVALDPSKCTHTPAMPF